MKTGTIHAFCAELLREFGARVGLERGFGIVDDEYQRAVLAAHRAVHAVATASLLRRFSAHRLAQRAVQHRNDAASFEKYERFLADRNFADFDTLDPQDGGAARRITTSCSACARAGTACSSTSSRT